MPALLTFNGAPQFGQFRSPILMHREKIVSLVGAQLVRASPGSSNLARFIFHAWSRRSSRRSTNEVGPLRWGSRIFVRQPQHSSIHAWASLFLSSQEK